MLNNSLDSLIGFQSRYNILEKRASKMKEIRELEELGLGKEAADKLSLLKRLSTGAKDLMTSSTNKISEGIKNIMSTPLSKKEMLNVLRNKRDKDIVYKTFAKYIPKKEKMKMIQDAIYKKRMKAIKSLKPTLNEGLIGASGLGSGLGLGYLLGSSSDDAE